jgi:hypothetical protein
MQLIVNANAGRVPNGTVRGTLTRIFNAAVQWSMQVNINGARMGGADSGSKGANHCAINTSVAATNHGAVNGVYHRAQHLSRIDKGDFNRGKW